MSDMKIGSMVRVKEGYFKGKVGTIVDEQGGNSIHRKVLLLFVKNTSASRIWRYSYKLEVLGELGEVLYGE